MRIMTASSLLTSIMKKEAAHSTETLVFTYNTTWCPEGRSLNTHHYENLKTGAEYAYTKFIVRV